MKTITLRITAIKTTTTMTTTMKTMTNIVWGMRTSHLEFTIRSKVHSEYLFVMDIDVFLIVVSDHEKPQVKDSLIF